MTTRTYYFPFSAVGRYIINYLIDHVGCSVGAIRKVDNYLAVAITTPTREVIKVERILQMYDLL